MKKQGLLFFTALSFYTRLPCPKIKNYDPKLLAQSTIYFPVIGALVGAIAFFTYWFISHILPTNIAVIMAIIASIITTGALHEDGFADVCDGFGGGYNKDKILQIMKDSTIGVYGAIGIGLLLFLKTEALYAIIIHQKSIVVLFLVFIAAQTTSRLAAISITFSYPYARQDIDSKSFAIADNYGYTKKTATFVIGLLPLIILTFYHYSTIIVLIPLVITRYYLGYYFNKHINGYTGDCIGATQQICEVMFYLSLYIVWKFI